jgi:hypothetical protein
VSEPEPIAAANPPLPRGAAAVKVEPCPEAGSTGVATSTLLGAELTNESIGVLTSVVTGAATKVTVEVVVGVAVTVTCGALTLA